MKRYFTALFTTLSLMASMTFSGCSDDNDFEETLPGQWQLTAAYDDGEPTDENAGDNLTILFESNGIYRMYDPVSAVSHYGTWILYDEGWLTMSMDKITGKNTSDGSYRFSQVPVRFTILRLEGDNLELRISTFLEERKKTIMFTQLPQDVTPTDPQEAMELDKANKQLHTYTYHFKRIQ